ncbi:hypothetical protein BGX31_002276 [Mortierella sp. GBA43]|nr:hypothetical protein BGX31_002276 [Mortierella sp. GBA43]
MSLEFFLKGFPKWPLEDEQKEFSCALVWIRDLSDILEGLTPSKKLIIVERQTTGQMAIWVKRWRLSRTLAERRWPQFMADFILESTNNRGKDDQLTSIEIAKFRQRDDEPTMEYICRVKLTVMLLPVDPAKDPSAFCTEMSIIKKFIYGLRGDHPYFPDGDALPSTLEEAYSNVLSSVTKRRPDSAETEEDRIIKKWAAAMSTETIFIGSHQVPRFQYAKFEDDFSQYPVDELPMAHLEETFLAWALASEEQDATTRIDKTIRRLTATTLALLSDSDHIHHILNSASFGPSSAPTPRSTRPRRGRKKAHAVPVVQI